MSAYALPLPQIHRRGRVATEQVDQLRHGLKMHGIDATWDLAKVVQFKPARNKAAGQFVQHPMRSVLASAPGSQAIAVPVSKGFPPPARRREGGQDNLGQEAINYLFRHGR